MLLGLILALGAVGGAAARSSWELTGTWYDPNGDPWMLTQFGSTLTWYAHSIDGHTWAHDFKGRISGNTFSGTYQDRTGFDRHFHGTITGRIRDECHMYIWLTVVGGNPVSGPLEKKPCKTRFRFVWKARGFDTEDRAKLQYIAKLSGGGTFVADGIGTLKAATGSLRVTHHFGPLADVWRITITAGRYHEDPVSTAELKVEADSVFSGKCDARPTGTLTLVDGSPKHPDRVVLRVCGEQLTFARNERERDDFANVLLAELK